MKKILLSLFCIFSLSAQISQKVIICGVCKDVADRVPYSIQIMEKIGALFSDYRIVVYENNSSDVTLQILKEWGQKNHRVCAMSECVAQNELENIYVNRTKNGGFYPAEAIARARNKVLDVVHSDAYNGFDYVIWMDMDFRIEPEYKAFEEIFASDREWDAVFAYGVDPAGTYWDWYAFRDQVCPLGSETLGHDWWYMPKNKQLLKKTDDWYPVISAFGGCGIYKKSALEGCRYSGVVTQDLAQLSQQIMRGNPSHPIIQQYSEGLKRIHSYRTIQAPSPNLSDIRDSQVGILTPDLPEGIVWRMSSFVYRYPSVCEHVTLHASMILRGHDKLFINPRLLFRYGG